MADGWLLTCPGHFTARNDQVPIVQEAGWGPGPVWTVAENLAPTRVRSLDHIVRSQSLYRLSYPTHRQQQKSPQFNLQAIVLEHALVSPFQNHTVSRQFVFLSYMLYCSLLHFSILNFHMRYYQSQQVSFSIANFPPPDWLVILRHFLHSRWNCCTAATRSAQYTWQDYKTNKDILSELKISPVLVKTQNYRRK